MKEKNKFKIPYIISMTIIGVAAIFLLIGAYLAFVPVNVARPNVQPYKVATPMVKAGEPIIYIADVCKTRGLPSIVSRRFVDEKGVRYPLPLSESNVKAGCTINGVPVATYPTMKPGRWYLALDVTYQVNFLRTETYHFETEQFIIK